MSCGLWSKKRQHKKAWQELKNDPVRLVEHYRKKNERRKNGTRRWRTVDQSLGME